MTVFDKQWFSHNQKLLLIALNNPIPKLRIGIRDKLGLTHFDDSIRISNYGTNNVIYQLAPDFKTGIFKSNHKNSDKLRNEYFKLWNTIHSFDIHFANRFFPKFNLGFDTLVFRPVAGANSPCDGAVVRNSANSTFTSLRDGAGTTADVSGAGIQMYLFAGTTADRYSEQYRAFLNFDTSSIDDTATIDSAILSLVMLSLSYTFAGYFCVTSATPAGTNTVVTGDYAATKTSVTRYANDSLISTLTGDDSTFNNFTFITAGKNAISKTGVTTIGLRNSWDADNTAPTWSSGGLDRAAVRSADNAGTTKDPYLTVNFTIPSTGDNSQVIA